MKPIRLDQDPKHCFASPWWKASNNTICFKRINTVRWEAKCNNSLTCISKTSFLNDSGTDVGTITWKPLTDLWYIFKQFLNLSFWLRRLKRSQRLTTMGTMGDDLTSFGRSAFDEPDRRGSSGGKKRKSSHAHGKKAKKFKRKKF